METEAVSAVTNTSQSPSYGGIIDEFETLWNTWYNTPTIGNALVLLAFLEIYQGYFESQASGKPVPHGWPPKTPFSHYYDAAMNSLAGWILHGCDPDERTPVSEWISDVNVWIKE
jgi:hypothetical protein